MKKWYIGVLVIASTAASIILGIAFQHNAMREFCIDPDTATCELDTAYMLGIWAFWFLIFTIPMLTSIFAYKHIKIKHFQSKK